MRKPLNLIGITIKRRNIARLQMLTVLTILFAQPLLGQDSSDGQTVRNVIWFTPAKSYTTINGAALGIMVTSNDLRINGLSFDIAPLSVFVGIYALFGTLAAPFYNRKKGAYDDLRDWNFPDSFTTRSVKQRSKISGVSVSLGGLVRDIDVSGVGLNGVISFANRVQGLEIIGLMNLHYEFKGVMIAGLRNKVTKGHGLQVGLINTCKEGRVVQIGLINRIGRRTTPFFNFRLRKT